MSKIFDMVHISQVGNLAGVSRDFRDIISRAKQMAGTMALLKMVTPGVEFGGVILHTLL